MENSDALYTFYPDKDSYGGDLIGLRNRNIESVRQIATIVPYCAGFNTNGALKKKIASPTEFVVWPETAKGAGIYVKRGFEPDLKLNSPETGNPAAYQMICINLARRADRRLSIQNVFDRHGLYVEFFDAIDGEKLTPDNPDLHLLVNNCFSNRRGVSGCALSHYNLWRRLANAQTDGGYVIFEDDIKLCDFFMHKLHRVIGQIPQTRADIVYLGFTINKQKLVGLLDKYYVNDTISINPIEHKNYDGGLFAYIVTRRGARNLVNYVETMRNGIRTEVDWIPLAAGLNLYSSHPHMAITESVQHHSVNVDSDIQKTHSRINPILPTNTITFDDYDFYPLKDSFGGDICELHNLTVNELHSIANLLEDCVAFNTHGWFKYQVKPIELLNTINCAYHINDGIYIKKSQSI